MGVVVFLSVLLLGLLLIRWANNKKEADLARKRFPQANKPARKDRIRKTDLDITENFYHNN